jgi:hypothetical protein
MHNAYNLNDSSNREHLLDFSTLDDARNFMSLVAMEIFLDVFDERTYQLSSETFETNPTVLQLNKKQKYQVRKKKLAKRKTLDKAWPPSDHLD